MPIEAMYWDWNIRAAEVHVLAGTTSPDLRVAHLRFQRRDAFQDPEYPFAKAHMDAHPGDVTLSFTIADAFAAPGSGTRSFATRGITLNGTTGQVTAAATLPALFPQNFLLETHAVSGTEPPFKELIRVHVHRGVQRIWLTPATMKVRPMRPSPPPDTVLPRFALRARFDDGTVGDITDWADVAWTSKRGATTTAHVGSRGRLTVTPADVAAADITITARLTSHPGVPAATAALRPVARWGPTAPIDVRLVPGGGWPHPFALEAVPNVLFVPDGFPTGSGTLFFNYVSSLVRFLKTEPLCKPFDVLADSINFWSAFIPSDQANVTWGSEVFAKAGDPGLVAAALPKPERPQDLPADKRWKLPHLIYEVGLPTPADRPGTPRTRAAIMADWDTLFSDAYRARLPADDDDREALVDFWRELGTRRILDDLDTPLGVMSGGPRVDSDHEDIDLNPDRMDRHRLEDLMSALRHEDVATSHLVLDTIWTDKRRRNYDLVCIVSAGPGREINGAGYFMISQGSVDEPPCTLSGANDITPVMPLIRGFADETEQRTFVHELSHSFDLGDEYGGTNDRPLFTVDVEHANRTEGNLQSPSSVKSGGVIHGNEIKWRWPRIQWAAEIIGPITRVSADTFRAPVRWRHAFAFPLGEIVHLRFRNIDFAFRDKVHDGVHFPDESAYLVKLPKVSVPLRLVDTIEIGSPPMKHVNLLVDTSVAFPYPDAQTIKPDAIVATFTPGSIVYRPTRAPAGVFDAAAYPYAELVAKNVRDHVTLLHGPIGHTNADFSVPQIPLLGSMPLPAWFPGASSPSIVGLYEGGMGNSTGVFHPAGLCSMNSTSQEDEHGNVVGVRFCHVCKYLLVDAIDPSRHLFIDPDYVAIYPQR